MSKEKDVALPSDEEGKALAHAEVMAGNRLARERDVRFGLRKNRKIGVIPSDADPKGEWKAIKEITQLDLERKIHERAGIELPVEEGARPLEVTCSNPTCGKIFKTNAPNRGGPYHTRCENCRNTKCSMEGCDTLLSKGIFSPSAISARNGRPPVCKKCRNTVAARARKSKLAAMSAEHRRLVTKNARDSKKPGWKSPGRGWNIYQRGDGQFVLSFRVGPGKWKETRIPRKIVTAIDVTNYARAWIRKRNE